jgi:hypothetical protein
MAETSLPPPSDRPPAPEVCDAVAGEAADPIEEEEDNVEDGPDSLRSEYWDDRYLQNPEPFDLYHSFLVLRRSG